MFTRVYEKVSKYSEPFGRRHYKNFDCRFAFGRKDLRDSLIKEFETHAAVVNEELCETTIIRPTTRSQTGNTSSYAFICFICNELEISILFINIQTVD